MRPGAVFEFNSTFSLSGRLWLKDVDSSGTWRVTRLNDGKTEQMTTYAIAASSQPTKVQIGQRWHDSTGKLFQIVRPVVARWYSWKVSHAGRELDDEIMDSIILGYWTLIGMASAAPSHVCPLCGAAGQRMFNLFDCSSSTCRNYSNHRGEDSCTKKS